jgi:PDZ domain-containing protein
VPFRLRYLVVPLIALGVVVAALWAIPTDKYVFLPDRARPLAEGVDVQGAHPRGGGDIYYVDVYIRKATLLERLLPFTRPDGATLVPAEAYLPSGISEAEHKRIVAAEMSRSAQIAPAVALRALGYNVQAAPTGVLVMGVASDAPAAGKLRENDVVVRVDGKVVRTPAELRAAIARHRPGEAVRLTLRRAGKTIERTVRTIPNPADPQRPIVGIQVDQAARIRLPLDVKIDIGRVGGPSAGLPFALEIARMLGRNVTHGCRIAATGELALDGTVLPIGGVKQKTIGARRTGVNLFLVPAGENAADARRSAGSLRIVPVGSFQQALRALATAHLKC